MAREAHITIRLESQDKSLIQRCASTAGFSLSEWIRQVCVEAAKRQPTEEIWKVIDETVKDVAVNRLELL